MSVVQINCPRCGAPATQKGEDPNEYICKHCNSIFVFHDMTKQTVTTDTAIHNCPYCGKQVTAGTGYKCVSCNENFFCGNCVSNGHGKYYCFSCIEKLGTKCNYCGHYRYYACVNCGKQSCKKHVEKLNFVVEAKTPTDLEFLWCPKCKGHVCLDCAKTRFFGGRECPRCHTDVLYYPIYR